MKACFSVFLLQVLILSSFCSNNSGTEPVIQNQDDPPQGLSGVYLGQTPPGDTPVRFAPGIISTGSDWGITFSPDGKECFFTRNLIRPTIMHCIEENGIWTSPAAASFSQPYNEIEPHITQNGDVLYFGSLRPLPGTTSSTDLHQWYVEKTASDWSEPSPMDFPLRDLFMMYPSVASNGNMYFTASDDPAQDQWISISEYVNGNYQDPEKLSDIINDGQYPAHPFIAPDESYIIFDVVPGNDVSIRELLISFRDHDGTWCSPVSLHDVLDVGEETACPYVSQDGNYLFFEHDGDIYWVDAQIIEGLRPDAPLDGRGGGVIAYCQQPVSGGDLEGEIHAVNADGSGSRRIISASVDLNYPDWSPDGERFTTIGYVSEFTWSIYVFDADGTDLERLTTTNSVWDTDPSWSPDGSQIVFTRIYPAQNNLSEIWIMNSDGSDQHWIGIEGGSAKWSPGGTRLIYHSMKSDNYDIYTCNSDGTNEQQLTSTASGELSPVWSPDGSQIAVTVVTMEGGAFIHRIYVMNSDGSIFRILTEGENHGANPRWSPDGSLISFKSEEEVYIVSVDGTNLRRVTNSPSGMKAINPVWRS